jgi:hypothetical protein
MGSLLHTRIRMEIIKVKDWKILEPTSCPPHMQYTETQFMGITLIEYFLLRIKTSHIQSSKQFAMMVIKQRVTLYKE